MNFLNSVNKHVAEARFLVEFNINPYDSNIWSMPPFVLLFGSKIVFIIADILSAYAIKEIYNNQNHIEPALHAPFRQFKKWYYWLNPLVLISNGLMDLNVIENSLVLSGIAMATRGNWFISSLLLAFATLMGFYPLSIVPFVALVVACAKKMSGIKAGLYYSASFLIWIIVISSLSCLFGFEFKNTFAVVNILNSNIIKPNIGSHWYFMSLVFEDFKPFFVFLFNIQPFVFIAPFLLRFKNLPLFAITVHLGINACLRAVPSISDINVWFLLLRIYFFTWKHAKFQLISGTILVFLSFLMPVMQYMWLVSRSANANFVYFLSLLLTAACCLIQMDCISSMLFYLADAPKQALISHHI